MYILISPASGWWFRPSKISHMDRMAWNIILLWWKVYGPMIFDFDTYIKPCISNMALYHIRLSKITCLAVWLDTWETWLIWLISNSSSCLFIIVHHQQRMIRGRHPQPYHPPGIHCAATFQGAAAGRTAGGRREESSTSNDERLDWTVPQEKWWPSMRSIGLSCLTVVPHNWIMDYYWNSGDLDDSTMKPSSWGNRNQQKLGFYIPRNKPTSL